MTYGRDKRGGEEERGLVFEIGKFDSFPFSVGFKVIKLDLFDRSRVKVEGIKRLEWVEFELAPAFLAVANSTPNKELDLRLDEIFLKSRNPSHSNKEYLVPGSLDPYSLISLLR